MKRRRSYGAEVNLKLKLKLKSKLHEIKVAEFILKK